jgi:hypothetical protein
MSVAGKFHCDGCRREIRSHTEAWVHLKLYDHCWFSFTCRPCKAVFDQVQPVLAHLASEAHLYKLKVPRTFACECRGAEFETKEELLAHFNERGHKACIMVKGFAPKIICGPCGEPFFSEKAIKRHLAEKHVS